MTIYVDYQTFDLLEVLRHYTHLPVAHSSLAESWLLTPEFSRQFE